MAPVVVVAAGAGEAVWVGVAAGRSVGEGTGAAGDAALTGVVEADGPGAAGTALAVTAGDEDALLVGSVGEGKTAEAIAGCTAVTGGLPLAPIQAVRRASKRPRARPTGRFCFMG
jgi:hypothetical protein